jgi:hypothetical protein
MAEQDSTQKEKFEALNRLLNDEYCVVHVDSAAPGLIVPTHLYRGQSVTLKLSKLFRGGIELMNDRIVCNLLFDKQYFECTIPLVSVWGVTSAKGSNIVWPQSAPQEILKNLVESASSQVISGDKDPLAESNAKAAAKGSHLRRIK